MILEWTAMFNVRNHPARMEFASMFDESIHLRTLLDQGLKLGLGNLRTDQNNPPHRVQRADR